MIILKFCFLIWFVNNVCGSENIQYEDGKLRDFYSKNWIN